MPYKANRKRYRSDVDFFDPVYDAEWRQSKYYSNKRDAYNDNINRVNRERGTADPGVRVFSGGVSKLNKKYKRKHLMRKG